MFSDRSRVLEFDRVSCQFGNNVVVASVSFDLERGQVLSLLGPSGCGKTTILRMASGLERAHSGRIIYRGNVVDCAAQKVFVPPNKRDMGMVFQSYGIWPHMNVFENVAFPLRTRRESNDLISRKVIEILRQVGLCGFETRPGTQLSGGQQQRVAVARGLVANPGVLLMDEPFSNLDVKLRNQLRAELKVLQLRLGLSILFVTHDQAEALSLSDRVAVIQNGAVEQIGTPEEVYLNPATPFVRDFVGDSIKLKGMAEPGAEGQECLLADGSLLRSTGFQRLGSGRHECTVSIRPEDIEILSDIDERPTNVIEVRVETLLFQGSEYEAILAIPGDERFMMRIARKRIRTEGEKMRLYLPPDKVQLWAAS